MIAEYRQGWIYPAIFAENQGTGAEGRIEGRFGHFKSPDTLCEFDLRKYSENPVIHHDMMLSSAFMRYRQSKSAFLDS